MADSRRHLPVAVTSILVAGGFMTLAGYVLATGTVADALWLTLPAWFAIEAGFAVIRRGDRLVGWPSPPPMARVREEGGILLAGAVMMLAGFAGGAWSWLLAVPLGVLGGFTVGVAALTGHQPAYKRRVVRATERYIANPPTKLALSVGLPLPVVLLETTGRRSGKRRRTPVMDCRIGEDLWIVAEHGRQAGYVKNLLVTPQVRVKRGRHWTEGVAEVLDDDDPAARAEWIATQLGHPKSLDMLAVRLFCVDPITVRVRLSPQASIEATTHAVAHKAAR